MNLLPPTPRHVQFPTTLFYVGSTFTALCKGDRESEQGLTGEIMMKVNHAKILSVVEIKVMEKLLLGRKLH